MSRTERIKKIRREIAVISIMRASWAVRYVFQAPMNWMGFMYFSRYGHGEVE